MNTRNILVVIAMLVFSIPVAAQGSYSAKNTSLSVKGTSTLHDWEMKASNVKGQASFVLEDGKLASVKDVNLVIPAEGLKSGKDAMDKNAYKSLQTSKYKTITFQLTRILNLERAGNNAVITAEGKLQIAGVTKVVTIKATSSLDSGEGIQLKGEKTIKMSDFNVEPPSFMFGSVKTGDEITIVFDITFSKNSIVSTTSN